MEQEQTGQSKLFSSNWSLTGGSGFKGLGNVFASPRNPRPGVSARAASREGRQLLVAGDTPEQPPQLGPARGAAFLCPRCAVQPQGRWRPLGTLRLLLSHPNQGKQKAATGAVRKGQGAPGTGAGVPNSQGQSRRLRRGAGAGWEQPLHSFPAGQP